MYTSQSYKEPFWAENSGFITGRDALGIQNSSIATYSRLLPGMTNLTLRLRYYGFYMWVLQNYYEKYGNNKEFTYKDQYYFVRKAELIMAFIMMKLHPEELSIIGSDYTKKNQNEIFDLGYFDLKKGADKSKGNDENKLYWDFDSGALGQYYAGSLIALKLIITSEGFFLIQEDGKKLASAFDSNLNQKQKELFLEAIETEKLNLITIESLSDFAINKILLKSEEWELYNTILIGNDGVQFLDDLGNETSLRKQSVKLYLDYIQENDVNYNSRSFIKWQYILNINEGQNDASFGWSYYYINEAIHFGLETIFWSILVDIENKERVFEVYIEELTERILNKSMEAYLSNSKSHLLLDCIDSCSDFSIISLLEDLENIVKSKVNNQEAIIVAFQLLLTIYEKNYARIEQINSFEKKYGVYHQKGRVSENFSLYIENKINFDFRNFVMDAVKMIINNHINSAYRKMGNGESNLLKFMIEDGIIYHIQTMPPTHTSPRLRALENFVTDLSLVTKERTLTKEGLSLLNLLK